MKRKRFEPHDLGHPAPPGLNERVEEGTRVAWDLVLKRWQGENIWITSGSKGRLCQYHFNHHCPPHPHPCPLTHCQEQELAGEAPSALLYHQHCHHDHQDEWQPGGNGAGVGWRSISSTRQHIRQDLSDSILSPDHVNHDGDIVEDMITIHDLTWMVANREYIHDCNWLKPALFWPRPRCNMHIPSPNIHQECKKNRWPRIDLSGKERITFFATWIYENKNGNCYYIQLERELHLRQMYLHLDIFTPKMYLHQEDLHLDIFTPR